MAVAAVSFYQWRKSGISHRRAGWMSNAHKIEERFLASLE